MKLLNTDLNPGSDAACKVIHIKGGEIIGYWTGNLGSIYSVFRGRNLQ